MPKPRVVAIIQARMGSTRLPGKVLRLLVGKPILWHIISRLRKSKTVDEIVIATSIESGDDPIVDFGKDFGVSVFRGPEDNVLKRFCMAAAETNAGIIVRITGDAPLVDPEIVDSMVNMLLADEDVGYATINPGTPCIHEGIDPFSRAALDRLASEAAEDPVAIEHVTAYFSKHPSFIKIGYIDLEPKDQFAGARISVDTPADLAFIEEIYSRLKVEPGEAAILDVVDLLTTSPELLSINQHVRQKRASEKNRNIIIRCDGSQRVGLGHIYRCMTIAEALRDNFSIGITFALMEGPIGVQILEDAQFSTILCPKNENEADWIDTLIAQESADGILLDVRTELAPERIAKWTQSGIVTAVLDDISERRLAASLIFYPPVPQVKKLNWSNIIGELYSGWQFVPLRKQFSEVSRSSPGEVPRILVAMGGSDADGLTFDVVDALDEINLVFEVDFLLGSAFSKIEELKARLASSKISCHLHHDQPNIATIMSGASFAVVSFGMTAYELLAVGVPSIIIGISEDHVESASIFEAARVGINLGLVGNSLKAELSREVASLLRDPHRIDEMAQNAQNLSVSNGSIRIAEIINNRFTL